MLVFWEYLKQPALVVWIEGQTTTTTGICVDSGFSFDKSSEVDHLIFTTAEHRRNGNLMTFLEPFREPPNPNQRGQMNTENHSGNLLKWSRNCQRNKMVGTLRYNYQTGSLK